MPGVDPSRRNSLRSAMARRWGAHTVICQVDLGTAMTKLWAARLTAEDHRTRWRGPDAGRRPTS